MAGLMSPQVRQDVQPRLPNPQDQAQDQGNVTPEEQHAYDQFVDNAYSLIYDQQSLPTVIQRLQATDDPIDDLANTAVMTVMRVQQSAQEAGQQIPDDVLYHGGAEIIEDLADLSAKSGGHKFTDKEVEGAFYRALDQYRQAGEQQGTVDPNSLKQQFSALQQADQAGQLGQVLPGVEKAARSKGPANAAGRPPKKRRRNKRRKGK